MIFDATLKSVTLVPFQRNHIGQTFTWVQNSELRRLFLMRGEITWEGHTAYFSRVLADPTQKIFAILSNKRHVGNCGYKNINLVKLEGELWIYIGEPSERGKGTGKRATELLIQEGEALGLRMIYLHVPDFNRQARHLYESLGFAEVPYRGNGEDWENRGCSIARMELKELR